jgi:hypothetical protein
MSTTPSSTKSKSRTFQKEELSWNVYDWLDDNLELRRVLEDRTFKMVLGETYVITITRYVDKKEEKK